MFLRTTDDRSSEKITITLLKQEKIVDSAKGLVWGLDWIEL